MQFYKIKLLYSGGQLNGDNTMSVMDQKNLIDDLKHQIARGQVVTVTGTGISVAACENQQVDGFSVATWTGLLKHGVHFCQHTESALNAKEAKAVLGQIRVGETDFLIAAAELVTKRLHGKRPLDCPQVTLTK